MADPLQHIYSPRGACREAFRDRRPEVLLAGPAGTGKTRMWLEKLNLQAMKYPGMRGLMMRKTQTSLGSTTLVTWRHHVITQALAAGVVRFYGGSPEHAAQYRYSNGSTITIGGLDKASKIMSSEYDVAYVGEAIELTVDDWEAITSRLRNGVMPYQQLVADTNPADEFHWLKQRCNKGQTVLYESRHTDNPVYYDDAGNITPAGEAYIVGKLQKLSGVRKLRLADGKWVSAEGVVFESYDPAVHLIDRFPIPPDWPRYWVVDFGFTNPFVCQWWAQDPDGRLYLYREIYRTGRLVEHHARDMLAKVTWRGTWTEPQPARIICDHDAEGRATLEKHLGFSTVAANKTVTAGLQAVEKRFQIADDGRPRMYLFNSALVNGRDPVLVEGLLPTCTEEEIGSYVWDNSEGKVPKETPVKKNDHGCDTMRYMVADLDLGSRPGIRWMY